jgi:hypothetical protein
VKQSEKIMSNKYTITDDIPIPEPQQRTHIGLTATLRSMEVGQSIVLPKDSRPNVLSIAQAAKLKIRTRSESVDTIRVWRVKDDT